MVVKMEKNDRMWLRKWKMYDIIRAKFKEKYD